MKGLVVMNFRKTIKSSKGFTLVEIMIVLAILGSIFALLAGRFAGARDKAKVKEANIQMGQISNALANYNLDCNKYPAALDGLKKADDCKNWGPNAYYQGKLEDPWGNPYSYEISGAEFVLKSLGKDKKDGGSGFDRDITWGEEEGEEKAAN
jgi:general secretion pathway protein G